MWRGYGLGSGGGLSSLTSSTASTPTVHFKSKKRITANCNMYLHDMREREREREMGDQQGRVYICGFMRMDGACTRLPSLISRSAPFSVCFIRPCGDSTEAGYLSASRPAAIGEETAHQDD
ncbi:hypothetical protein EYF80_028076 [Liparis tanakae]|uniref:Uncharacterized protein n=1 Tax=Liparis tanakae TaxID=230148 RepID=A0A4Z2HA09_9TELE|nr:hypothetical protein EYF80_028076 [Liparis tanakae]